MKTSPRLNVSSVMKRSFVTFGAALLAVLAFNANALAATPVDIFQDMESGNNNDVLTAAIMNASSHGSSSWSTGGTGGSLYWVSTGYSRNLPGPVTVGGVTYNGTGGTRSWKVNDNTGYTFLSCHLPGSYNYATVACYFTPNVTVRVWNNFDSIAFQGWPGWAVLQTINGDAVGPNLRCHSCLNGNSVSPNMVKVVAGKTYWVNLHYDAPAGAATVAIFDPDNGYAQVGSNCVASATVNGQTNSSVQFGRLDNHGNNTDTTTQTYFDNIIVDYTYGTFPLIPSAGTDTTPPSAPGSVRDGTGTDIAYTTSTTQLSANWDASTDTQSGISGYQYAIGTSAGGTQTVNWTSLGNVTTVTKTGLSLTSGQTYFFSVKAINGVGLTGNATNSNGQKVDTSAPSAPATVRDGTGTDISTTSSTTQLSANWDASTDNESGISGYQYAIGTSAGGTQTVNFTSLANVTTVTKTGLSLTVGQTYYFSVKAVNGVGLTGSATNSNGQTVVAVGAVTYFSDNFENWTVHGGAWSSVNGESSAHTLNTSTDQARAGTKSLKLTDTETTGSNGAYLTKNFSPVISGDIYVRFYLFLPTGYGSTNVNRARRMLRIFCGSNRGQMSIKNDACLMEEIGAWHSATGSTMSENAWHCIEMHVAPPSASTLLEFWVDGVANSTNLTANFSTSSTFDHIDLGDIATDSADASTATFYLDELVVSNSYVGPITSVTYFSDNFENWTVHGGAWSSVNGESSSHILNTSTDQAKAGTKSLKITDNDTVGTTGAYLTKNFSPAIAGDIYVRFYVFFPTGYSSANTGTRKRLLRAWCGSDRIQLSFQNDQAILEEIGNWSSTYGATISENAWHCVETHGATPSASSLVEFWVDGVKNSTTLNGAFVVGATWDYMELGDIICAGTDAGTGSFYLDEVAVSDTYVGTLP